MKFKTFFGKEISWFRNPRSFYQIKFTTGGELPECLQGEFTSYPAMEIAIITYLENSIPKKQKAENAKNTKQEAV